jgi:hypothetical protein
MPKVLPKLGPYEIIPDTNALFARDSRKLVSGGFETALAELRKIAPVNLRIPRVVLGEMAYQKFFAALSALQSAEQNLSTIHLVTGEKPQRLPSRDQIKKSILRRYDEWLNSIGGHILKPRIAQRTWEKVVDDAIWRVAPFEHSEDSKIEKGFRDRVVLESVIQFCKTTENEVVLLCKDGQLVDGMSACGIKSLSIHPRLEDFASRVRLMKDSAEKEWVNELFQAATREFYEKDNPECIYYRGKVYEPISAKTSDSVVPNSALGSLVSPANWERKTDERLTIGTTRFEKNHDGRWVWNTDVKSAAAFAGKDFLDLVHESIRITTFSVKWTSVISKTAEIRESKLEAVEIKDRQLVTDNGEERVKWSLPPKPDIGRSLLDLLKTPANQG